MKKNYAIILLSLLVALLVAGCSGDKEMTETTAAQVETTMAAESVETTQAPEETTAPTEALYIPEISPDTVGLYIPVSGSKDRQLVREFQGSRTAKTDIDCFEVFASDDELIPGDSFTAMWKNVWNSHENAENAKIGFHIEFQLENGDMISKNLLKPSDSDEFFDYLEIYMYDDINQTPGAWYTHLSDGDMKEETIISSIKLHCGSNIDQISGDILLTAFIYTGEDCFDGNGNYIGQVSASVLITE